MLDVRITPSKAFLRLTGSGGKRFPAVDAEA
jgi:hypothetical protein